MSELYTTSRLGALLSCPRLHHYRYDLGLQTPTTDSQRFGAVGHAALEAWYRVWCAGKDVEVQLECALAALDVAIDLSPVDRAKLEVLVRAYHVRWTAQPWTVLAVEQEFRYELDGRTIGGKIDAIIRDDTTGLIWIVEHKTTRQSAEPGSPYWERLQLDNQISIYVDGATMLGYDVAGVIYDVLVVPRHEPKLATPVEERQYTQGKGCKICGGNLQGKQGTGAVSGAPCNACHASGWRHDEHGKPEAPRLHARMRDTDETIDEFKARLVEAIAETPDDFLVRGTVVRLADELPRMRLDVIDTIRLAEYGAACELHPRNPGNCAKYGVLCPFFSLCAGRAGESDFQRGPAHPELAATNP